MIRRLSLYEFYFRICCFLLPVVAFLISGIGLRSLEWIHPLGRDYLYLCVILTLVWILCSVHFDVTNVEELFLDSIGVRNCLKAIAWTYMSGFSALFFYRQASFSRLMMGSSALILLGGILLLRLGFRRLIKHSGRQVERLRVVIIGADEFAEKTSERLKNSLVMPCETVAFVRIPGQSSSLMDSGLMDSGVPVFELEQLMGRTIKHFTDDIVIAASPEVLPILSGLIRQLRELAVPIRFCLDFGADVKVRDRFFRLGGTHILDVQIAPSETISYLILKRCFDVVFSLLALAITAIPMALIALAVKWSSPGPVFFTQERVGINGQGFRMLKFRTMRVAPVEESDTRWTTGDDSRRTRFGVLLRRSCLDELPQFFNVLRGEMSVVGPRPERPHFVKKFNDEIDAYNTRHHLKSGITGWAQVNGLRGDTDMAKRVELDLYYLQHWSLTFDLQIILMTVFSGIFAQNAY
jgi:Undecaprenyl-phosphate glucose phosphotransferase